MKIAFARDLFRHDRPRAGGAMTEWLPTKPLPLFFLILAEGQTEEGEQVVVRVLGS
jgi:hypothetical protein